MPKKLRSQHEELRIAMRDFVALIKETPLDLATVSRTRFELACRFRRYLDEEQQLVRRMPDSDQHRQAIADMQTLLLDYSVHIGKWTSARIAADQSGYIRAAEDIQRLILRRMSWEAREMIPKMEGAIVSRSAAFSAP